MEHEQRKIDGEVAALIRAEIGRSGLSVRETTIRAAIPYATFDRKLTTGSFTIAEIGRIAAALAVSPAALVPFGVAA